MIDCARDRRGTAALEFALLMPVLMLLLLGLADIATRTSRTLQVEAAARAGASYARRHGWHAAAITAAAAEGLNTLRDARAEVRLLQGCLDRNARLTPARRCPGGGTPGSYVLVSVTAASPPLLLRGTALLPDAVAGQALVRID